MSIPAVARAQSRQLTAKELTPTTTPQLVPAFATKLKVPKPARSQERNLTNPLANASALLQQMKRVSYVTIQDSGTSRVAHAFVWETRPAHLVTHTTSLSAVAPLMANLLSAHLKDRSAQALLCGTIRLVHALATPLRIAMEMRRLTIPLKPAHVSAAPLNLAAH